VQTPSERVADLRWIAPGETHPMRQNSEFSTLAAIYKNAVPLTVRRPTVAGIATQSEAS